MPRLMLLGTLPLLLVVLAGGSDPAAWSVSVLAVTGSRGALHICNCPGSDYGGPAMRGGLFKTARTWAVPTVIVDGGDFFPEPQETLAAPLADLAVETMTLLAHDVVGVGETEVAMGRARLVRAAGALPLVCANLEGIPEIPPFRWVKAGNRRIAVVGYVDPTLVAGGDSVRVVDPVSAVQKAVAAIGTDADLVVLLAHATVAQVTEILPELQGIQVVVAGHPTEDPRILKREGDIPVLAPRALTSAAQLTMTRTAAGSFSDLRPRSWNLKEIQRGDPRIEKITRAFEERWELR